MSRQPKKFAVAVTVAALIASPLAACGSDEESGDDTTAPAAPAETTAAPVETTAVSEPSATTVASSDPSSDQADDPDEADPAAFATFCEAFGDITISMSGEPDPALLIERIATVDETAPDEVATQVGVMTSAVTAVLASGGADFSPLESPEFADAQAEVDPYVFENCEFSSSVEVSGVDYAYAGIPASITAGRVAMMFTNDGADAHELVIMRRNDGVTEEFEELLSLPEEEAMTKVTPAGGAFAPSNGSQALMVGDFEAGDYIAICFIPVGTGIGADGEFIEGTGEPHFVQGMQQEFTVS